MTGIINKAHVIFSNHLEARGLRKTKERYHILHEIYSRNDHFDAEQLYLKLKKKRLSISRATVYNTLDLLVECDLIRRHRFGNQQAQYEKSYSFRQHDHLICSDCGHVFEFCDPRIHQIQEMAGTILGFGITNHSLTLLGKCNTFASNGRCKYRKSNK